jgi:hypothetical protein
MVWAIIAAATGGFFIGAWIFFYLGKAKGYVTGVTHTLRLGAAVNLAQEQAKAVPASAAATPRGSTRGMN